MVAVATAASTTRCSRWCSARTSRRGLLNVEQDFGCVNVLDHDGERFILRLLNFTSYDPLKADLKLPAVRILAGADRRAARSHQGRGALSALKSVLTGADTVCRD